MDGRDDSVVIHQDVNLYVAYLTKNTIIKHESNPMRKTWVQLIKGKITLEGQTLSAGDGAAIEGENLLEIHAKEDSELMVFDLG